MSDIQIGVRYDAPSQPPDNGDGLGLGSRVTRQIGLAPTPPVGFDPTPPAEIIQPGIPDMVVTRNSGPHVRGYFDASGIFRADSVADDGSVVYADGGVQVGVSNQPPGLARIAAPLVADPNQPVPRRPAGFGEMAAARQREAVKAAAEAMGFIVTDVPGAKDSPPMFDASGFFVTGAPGVPPAVGVVASDQPGENHDPRDMSSGPQVLDAGALPVIKKAPIVPVITAPNALPEPRSRRVRAKAGPTAKAALRGKK